MPTEVKTEIEIWFYINFWEDKKNAKDFLLLKKSFFYIIIPVMVLAGGHSCYRKFKFKFYIYSSSIKRVVYSTVTRTYTSCWLAADEMVQFKI